MKNSVNLEPHVLLTILISGLQVLNRELEQANNVLRTKRSEVQRIEDEVALLMQVSYCRE